MKLLTCTLLIAIFSCSLKPQISEKPTNLELLAQMYEENSLKHRFLKMVGLLIMTDPDTNYFGPSGNPNNGPGNWILKFSYRV